MSENKVIISISRSESIREGYDLRGFDIQIGDFNPVPLNKFILDLLDKIEELERQIMDLQKGVL